MDLVSTASTLPIRWADGQTPGRSLLYYVFLAAATIFSNIIRDTRYPQVREDLASINMAATFFASLVPGDGPANYAESMTRMSATLERIARVAVEKDEKRPRDTEERDQESQQPGAKRHNHRTTSKPHSRTRHGPSTLRASMTPNTPASHRSMEAAPAANTIPPTHSHTPDPSIPETLEGFPPVNSSGYVVPISPDDTTTHTPTTTTFPTSLGLSNLNETQSTNFPASYPAGQPAHDHPRTTSPFTNIQNSNSTTTSTRADPTTIPDSWQVPLTADWSYGDNLWSGLFPTEAIAASAQAQEISFPILSAESFLTVPREAENTSPGPGLGYITEDMGYMSSLFLRDESSACSEGYREGGCVDSALAE